MMNKPFVFRGMQARKGFESEAPLLILRMHEKRDQLVFHSSLPKVCSEASSSCRQHNRTVRCLSTDAPHGSIRLPINEYHVMRQNDPARDSDADSRQIRRCVAVPARKTSVE